MAASNDVTRRKGQQRRVLALAQESQNVRGGSYILCQRIAQVRVKVRQTRAVDDHVERLRELLSCFRRQVQSGLADVARHHLNPLAQESRKILAVPGGEPLENRRFLDDSLKTFE